MVQGRECPSYVSIVHCSKPIACLYGHDSPVFSVQVDSEKKRIYSVGNDSTVKVRNSPLPPPSPKLDIELWGYNGVEW